MFQMNLIKNLKTSYEIVLSNDKKLLCHLMGGKTVIFDTKTWEKVIELKKPNNPSHLHFSQNDEMLYIKNTVGTFCVYNTKDFQLIKTIKSGKSFQIVEGNFALLDNPFTILDVLKINDKKQVCTLNIETGIYQVLTELEGSHIEFNQFVPNDNSYLFTLYYLKEINGDHYSRQKLVKVKNPLTEPSYSFVSSLELQNWDLVYFEPVHQVYIFVHKDYELTIMDANLKNILRKEHLLDKGIKKFKKKFASEIEDDLYELQKILDENENEYFVHIAASYDGNYIVLTSSDRVYILGFEDLAPIHIEELEYACFAEFSKDDTYFLVGTWTKGFVFENNLKGVKL
ncbi:hypothetical protein M3610_10540 [Neobacillus sp. MER 74]|uniref:hypothetical protein n=1 Tax=Neobacillus sp. MER 74 TaxID=2939566 RepID=UPI0020425A47|nr:hypothetical protein [Neobacillus sp. MER 74]MCM3115726.1 hypothetical protein [Neobacillus sp. MER 74]